MDEIVILLLLFEKIRHIQKISNYSMWSILYKIKIVNLLIDFCQSSIHFLWRKCTILLNIKYKFHIWKNIFLKAKLESADKWIKQH